MMTEMTTETTKAPEKRWYVIHTYSGYENKVKANLEHRIESMGVEDQIFQVLVPMEEEIERGQVLAKPGSVKPHTKFSAQVYVLTKEEGGRHTPFYNGYRPQFYLRTTDVTGAIGLPDGAEMIMPGDNVEMSVELITPIAIEIGQRFAIREGGRTVGAGAIVSIVE